MSSKWLPSFQLLNYIEPHGELLILAELIHRDLGELDENLLVLADLRKDQGVLVGELGLRASDCVGGWAGQARDEPLLHASDVAPGIECEVHGRAVIVVHADVTRVGACTV